MASWCLLSLPIHGYNSQIVNAYQMAYVTITIPILLDFVRHCILHGKQWRQ